MATSTKLRKMASKQGLGALELAFPCVICSFTVVILLLCFCCCPVLLYRLRGEIGYDYEALLFFMLALILFGVVGEILLIARRRGRLGACCCRRPDEERPRATVASGTSVAITLGDDHLGSLRGKPAPKAQLCDVHGKPRGPPPAYDFVSTSSEKPQRPKMIKDNPEERAVQEEGTARVAEEVTADAK